MAAKINWGSPIQKNAKLFFNDLSDGETFRIATNRSRGAVYMAVSGGSGRYMLELATGELYNPSDSEVELIPVEINIGVAKPSIY